jgi:hypothetical protein
MRQAGVSVQARITSKRHADREKRVMTIGREKTCGRYMLPVEMSVLITSGKACATADGRPG